MEYVDPIRSLEDLEMMKAYLRRQSMRNAFLLTMGVNVGRRISDILPKKVRDVREATHLYFKEKKTGKPISIKINQTLRAAIDEYIVGMDDEVYLFASRTGGGAAPIGRVQAWRILSDAAHTVGIKDNVGAHTLRKTFGYHYYTQTKDIATLQKLFGHSSPSITLRYIGIVQDDLDAAVDSVAL